MKVTKTYTLSRPAMKETKVCTIHCLSSRFAAYSVWLLPSPTVGEEGCGLNILLSVTSSVATVAATPTFCSSSFNKRTSSLSGETWLLFQSSKALIYQSAWHGTYVDTKSENKINPPSYHHVTHLFLFNQFQSFSVQMNTTHCLYNPSTASAQ